MKYKSLQTVVANELRLHLLRVQGVTKYFDDDVWVHHFTVGRRFDRLGKLLAADYLREKHRGKDIYVNRFTRADFRSTCVSNKDYYAAWDEVAYVLLRNVMRFYDSLDMEPGLGIIKN